jgi:uncharacterized protein YrrD
MLEDLHIGVSVSGRDGARLGTLKRIVVERDGQRVLSLVVEPGLIESGNALAPGGWDKPRARVVPAGLVRHAGDQRLELDCDETAFRQFPLFEEEQAITVEQEQPAGTSHARFQLGDVIRYISSAAGLGGAPYLPPESVSFDEPSGSAEIAEGTPVWRRQPPSEIGEVERVLLDAQTQRIAALVVKRKGLFGHRVLLPMSEVSDIEDGVVHITLGPSEVDALQPYQPEG